MPEMFGRGVEQLCGRRRCAALRARRNAGQTRGAAARHSYLHVNQAALVGAVAGDAYRGRVLQERRGVVEGELGAACRVADEKQRRSALAQGTEHGEVLMFGTHDIWLFVISGLLLNITPGPDTLYIVGRSSTQGWRAGAVAALGIGAGALVHICAAALGLSALLAASATVFTAVKIIGAAYLVYVGISLIRAKGSAQSPPIASGNRPAPLRGIFFQ